MLGFKVAAIPEDVVGGNALLVIAPLDIYQIGKNSYDLYATYGSNGKNESDATIKWYIEQIKKMKEPHHNNDDNDDQHESTEDDHQQFIATVATTQLQTDWWHCIDKT